MQHADALSRNVNAVDKELILTRDRIHEEQEKDDVCMKLKQFESFWVDKDGILCRQEAKEHPRVVIPRALVETVLKCYHELPFTAHQGMTRTLSFISRKYWWGTMRNDVSIFIKNCDACARRKTGHRAVAPLGESLEANEFLDVVSLDIVGLLPVTERGNKYLLTFVDHFTRFCEAIPIVRQDTERVAREFVTKIVAQFGVPKKLLTDREANFTSSLLQETCRLLRIRKLQTSSYNPQANGICERMHKLLIDMLSHFVRKDAKNWDEYVPYAVMAYRAMPHCSTNSPYYLVFGKDMRLPIEDDWKPHLSNRVVGENEYEEHVRTLAGRLREAHRAASQQSKMSHEVAKRYYDRHAKLEQYRKGDLVYIYDPVHKRGKARKFSYQYKGPFEIEHRISPLVYKIRMTDGTFAIVHTNRLKKAQGQQKILNKASPVGRKVTKTTRREQPREHVLKEHGDVNDTEQEGNEIFSTPQLRTVESDTSEIEDDEEVSLRNREEDPEWDPGSSYLRQEVLNDNIADGVAYRLRSRLVGRSGREAETDKARSEVNDPPGNKILTQDTQEQMLAGKDRSHSYNLRSRVVSPHPEQNE
jgi:hypothetical protein